MRAIPTIFMHWPVPEEVPDPRSMATRLDQRPNPVNGRAFIPYHRDGDPRWHPSQVVIAQSDEEDRWRGQEEARAEHQAIVAAAHAELKRQGRI